MPRYNDIYIGTNNLRMNFPIFDLPATTTCPGRTKLCVTHCYAHKAERQYPNSLKSRLRNYYASQKPDFVNHMVTYINRLNPKYFRIHSSGDFYAQEYLDKWIEIAGQCRGVNFLAYTQNYGLDWSGKANNFIVYWSVWPDSPKAKIPSSGLKAYVVNPPKLTKLPLYPKSISPSPKTFKCPKTGNQGKCNDCMHCFQGRGDVVFELH